MKVVIFLPSPRSRSASRSPSLSTADEYAPARPRSLVMIRIAALVGFSGSVVSGWSTSEYVASAETARVSSRAYGAACCARCCALMMRDAAMSSMARVIFFIDSVDLIRARYSRSDRAISDQPRERAARQSWGWSRSSASLLLDDLLLLELVVLHGLLLVAARVDRPALRGLEL